MCPSILLTRPEDASRRFAARLRDRLGPVDVVIAPLLKIRPLVQDVDPQGASALILTSAQAARFGVPGMRCYCVGDATAQAARVAGMHPISAKGDAQDLVRRILADAPLGPLLHIRGTHSRGDVAQRLTDAGVPTREIIAYDQEAQPLCEKAQALFSGETPVIVPVFSPRTAWALSKAGHPGPNVQAVALSAAVGEMLKNFPSERIETCVRPDAEAMIATIEGLMDAAS
ncbi:uroporphyrinogen-III synthase [Thalassovita sp.]|jgi:uroporphyrinogen-III synthase|uniref:uroporphyrinogen-III synthase n=1 Tax=Thalassovita sp. TaxID=1979401 RepID=UPI003B5CCF40